MRRSQSWLTMILLFAGLLVIALFWTALGSMFLGFLYRNAAGLSATRGVTQIASILTAAGLYITALLVAIPVAFQAGSQLQKAIYAIPLFLLLFTLVGVVTNLIGIGTTGTLVDLGSGTTLNFSSGWVAAGLVLSTLAVVIAAARTPLAQSIVINATRAAAATGVLGVIAAVAVVASVVIVSGSQPTFGFPGGGPGAGGPTAQGTQQAGQGGAGQNRQGNGGGPATQGTQQAGPGGAGQGRQGNGQGGPAAQGTQQAGQGAAGQNRQGNGQGGPGGGPGGPGGPGGGIAGITRPFTTGGIAAGILGLLMLVGIVGGMRSLGSVSAEPEPTVQADYQHGGRSVFVSLIVVGVVVLVAIQFIPVTRDNPPITTTIQWDSPQTKQLFENACANCHSNETIWPWYSYVAPTSWLTTMHVHSGRRMYNFSENDTAQLARFAQNAGMAIRTGEMPPSDFLIMHPEARLSDAEKQQLIDGLQKTFPRQSRQQGFNLGF